MLLLSSLITRINLTNCAFGEIAPFGIIKQPKNDNSNMDRDLLCPLPILDHLDLFTIEPMEIDQTETHISDETTFSCLESYLDDILNELENPFDITVKPEINMTESNTVELVNNDSINLKKVNWSDAPITAKTAGNSPICSASQDDVGDLRGFAEYENIENGNLQSTTNVITRELYLKKTGQFAASDNKKSQKNVLKLCNQNANGVKIIEKCSQSEQVDVSNIGFPNSESVSDQQVSSVVRSIESSNFSDIYFHIHPYAQNKYLEDQLLVNQQLANPLHNEQCGTDLINYSDIELKNTQDKLEGKSKYVFFEFSNENIKNRNAISTFPSLPKNANNLHLKCPSIGNKIANTSLNINDINSSRTNVFQDDFEIVNEHISITDSNKDVNITNVLHPNVHLQSHAKSFECNNYLIQNDSSFNHENTTFYDNNEYFFENQTQIPQTIINEHIIIKNNLSEKRKVFKMTKNTASCNETIYSKRKEPVKIIEFINFPHIASISDVKIQPLENLYDVNLVSLIKYPNNKNRVIDHKKKLSTLKGREDTNIDKVKKNVKIKKVNIMNIAPTSIQHHNQRKSNIFAKNHTATGSFKLDCNINNSKPYEKNVSKQIKLIKGNICESALPFKNTMLPINNLEKLRVVIANCDSTKSNAINNNILQVKINKNVKPSKDNCGVKFCTENNLSTQIITNRGAFSNDSTILHHIEILNDIKLHKNIVSDTNGKHLNVFSKYVFMEIENLIVMSMCSDRNYLELFQSFQIPNFEIEQNVSMLKENFFNIEFYKALSEFSTKEQFFHAKLSAFTQENYFHTSFTFNNLLLIICNEACFVETIKFNNLNLFDIRQNIISILKQSSIETFIYYGVICKIIDYMENNCIRTIHIEDFGKYFAILNVLNTLVRFKWPHSNMEQIPYDILRYKYLNNFDAIMKKEKDRQIFYRILLYIMRPFVSEKRYMQAWHKYVLQELNYKHLRSHLHLKKNNTICYKIFLYQCLDMLLFQYDNDAEIFCPRFYHEQPNFFLLEYMLKENHLYKFLLQLKSSKYQNIIKQYICNIYTMVVHDQKKTEENQFLYDNYLEKLRIYPKSSVTDDNIISIDIVNTINNGNEKYISRYKPAKLYIAKFICCPEELMTLCLYKFLLFNSDELVKVA
ncbi:hypothetical protein COBT_000991 [Conglomerata obtusa]